MRVTTVAAILVGVSLGACGSFVPRPPVIDYAATSDQWGPPCCQSAVGAYAPASLSRHQTPSSRFPASRRRVIDQLVAECQAIAGRAEDGRNIRRQSFGGALLGGISGALAGAVAGDGGASAVLGIIGAIEGGLGGAWSGAEVARDRRELIVRECLAARGVQSY